MGNNVKKLHHMILAFLVGITLYHSQAGSHKGDATDDDPFESDEEEWTVVRVAPSQESQKLHAALSRISSLESDRAELLAAQQQTDELHKKEVASYQQRLAALEGRLAALQEERAHSSSDATTTPAHMAAQHIHTTLQGTRGALEAIGETSDALRHELCTIKHQLDTAQYEVQRLSHERDTAVAKLGELKTKGRAALQRLKEENRTLQERIAALEETLAAQRPAFEEECADNARALTASHVAHQREMRDFKDKLLAILQGKGPPKQLVAAVLALLQTP